MNTAVANRDDIDEVLGILRDFMQAVDNRFSVLENRFDSLEFRYDGRFDAIDTKLGQVKESQNKVLNVMDSLVGRIDTYEIENAARDAQTNRLITWARKSNKANDIPLEDL